MTFENRYRAKNLLLGQFHRCASMINIHIIALFALLATVILVTINANRLVHDWCTFGARGIGPLKGNGIFADDMGSLQRVILYMVRHQDGIEEPRKVELRYHTGGNPSLSVCNVTCPATC